MVAHYFYGTVIPGKMDAIFSGKATVDSLKKAAKEYEFNSTETITLWSEIHMVLVGKHGSRPVSHDPLSQAIVGVDFIDDGQVAYTSLEDLPPIIDALNKIDEEEFLQKYVQQNGKAEQFKALAELKALQHFYSRCKTDYTSDDDIIIVGVYCD